MKDELLVALRDLTISFHTLDGVERVLQGVNLVIHPSEIVGLVGETGCGKSITAKILLGILPIPPAVIERGEVRFLDKDLLTINKGEREILKQYITYVPQDPMTSLNPVFSIGTFMVDMIIWRMSKQKLSQYLWKRRNKNLKDIAEKYAVELLNKVHIPEPGAILSRYPSELSGGMRQRVLLAMALSGSPRLLVADEPTTALDATIQKRTILLIQEKVQEEKLSGLYITHNLGVARIICDRTYVMYAGTVVESAKTLELLDRPLHPYTQGLVNSIPSLTERPFKGIAGQVPDYLNPPSGCRFHPRCNRGMKVCSLEVPKLRQIEKTRLVACWLYY
jgi:oligopeptide/dipeptide ABC transporter ATP-binding protein